MKKKKTLRNYIFTALLVPVLMCIALAGFSVQASADGTDLEEQYAAEFKGKSLDEIREMADGETVVYDTGNGAVSYYDYRGKEIEDITLYDKAMNEAYAEAVPDRHAVEGANTDVDAGDFPALRSHQGSSTCQGTIYAWAAYSDLATGAISGLDFESNRSGYFKTNGNGGDGYAQCGYFNLKIIDKEGGKTVKGKVHQCLAKDCNGTQGTGFTAKQHVEACTPYIPSEYTDGYSSSDSVAAKTVTDIRFGHNEGIGTKCDNCSQFEWPFVVKLDADALPAGCSVKISRSSLSCGGTGDISVKTVGSKVLVYGYVCTNGNGVTNYNSTGQSAHGTLTITLQGGNPTDAEVNCVDMVKGTSVVLGEHEAETFPIGATASGSHWGTVSPYNGYAYDSCTNLVVTADGGTVYRYFTDSSYGIQYHSNYDPEKTAVQSKLQPASAVTLYSFAQTGFSKRTSQYGSREWKFAGWSDSAGAANSINYGEGKQQVFASQVPGSVKHLYAVWQPSLKVTFEQGIDGVTVLGEDRRSDVPTYHPYNTALNNCSVSMRDYYHLKDVLVNGQSMPEVIQALNAGNGSFGNMTDCMTVHVIGEPNPEHPVKKVYKHGTDVDVNGCLVSAGDKLDYAITITNSTAVARDVIITDELDGGVTYDTGSADNGGTYADGRLAWSISQIPAGASETVHYTVTVSPSGESRVINNVATTVEKAVAALGESVDVMEVSNTVTNYIMDAPVKHLYNGEKKTLDSMVLGMGDSGVYNITFKNTAAAVKTFDIVDTIPEGMRIVSVSDGGGVEGQEVSWKGISVEPGAEKTVSIHVEVMDGTTASEFHNEASITCGDAQKTSAVSNRVDNFILKDPEKTVLDADGKDIGGLVKSAGDILTYRITWENPTGEEQAVTITDVLPGNTEFVSAGTADGTETAVDGKSAFTYDENTHTVIWTVSTPAKSSGSVTVNVRILDGARNTILKNSATVHIPNATKETNQVETPVMGIPVKTVWNASGKEITGKMVSTGDTITYRITWENPSGVEKSADITDSLPEEVSFVSADNGGTYDEASHLVKWTGIKTDVHGKNSVSVTVKVREQAAGMTVRNQGTVFMDEAEVKTHARTEGSDPENPEPSDRETTDSHVLKKPVKSMYLGASVLKDGSPVTAGSSVTFRIEYSNPGDTDRKITVSDTLDANIVNCVTAISDGGRLENGTITWNVDAKAGTEGSVSFTIISPELDRTEIKNRATVSLDKDTAMDTNTVHYLAQPGDFGREYGRRNPDIVKTGDMRALSLLGNK